MFNDIKRPKRLVLEVSDSDHIEVKRRADEQGLSISKWLIEAIRLKAKIEDQEKK